MCSIYFCMCLHWVSGPEFQCVCMSVGTCHYVCVSVRLSDWILAALFFWIILGPPHVVGDPLRSWLSVSIARCLGMCGSAW